MNENKFLEIAGVEKAVICGAMYPCSNPELVAAVSEAGGLGIIQPLSLVYVFKHDFREGLRYIKSLTSKPVGLNVIIEQSSKRYIDRMNHWLDIALEEGVRFFVSALGKPDWVVKKVKKYGGYVFHDVVGLKHAQIALDAGVDGFICVNNRAGGHAGHQSAQKLYDELAPLNKTLVLAGGISQKADFQEALKIGFAGVQLGTRFIASKECNAHIDYKKAILAAKEKDIVLSEKITGVPVSVINTSAVQKMGIKANYWQNLFLKNKRLKHLGRAYFTLKSILQLKNSNLKGNKYKNFYQAGKSVEGIHQILSAQEIINKISR